MLDLFNFADGEMTTLQFCFALAIVVTIAAIISYYATKFDLWLDCHYSGYKPDLKKQMNTQYSRSSSEVEATEASNQAFVAEYVSVMKDKNDSAEALREIHARLVPTPGSPLKRDFVGENLYHTDPTKIRLLEMRTVKRKTNFER